MSLYSCLRCIREQLTLQTVVLQDGFWCFPSHIISHLRLTDICVPIVFGCLAIFVVESSVVSWIGIIPFRDVWAFHIFWQPKYVSALDVALRVLSITCQVLLIGIISYFEWWIPSLVEPLATFAINKNIKCTFLLKEIYGNEVVPPSFVLRVVASTELIF